MACELILVTGSSGFIGSRIVQRLRADERGVIGLARRDPGDRPSLAGLENTIRCDLHDHAAVRAAVAHHQPTACIHAAWDVTPATYRDSPENARWIDSSVHLAESLLDHGCTWIGALGTGLETHEQETGRCAYTCAKSKLHERLELCAAASPGARLCWLRIFQAYGPGEHADRLLPRLLEAGVTGTTIELQAPDRVLDFIHVDDIAGAVVAALDAGLAGAYDVATGQGHRLVEVARWVARRCDHPRLVGSPTATSTTMEPYVGDPGPLGRASGWCSEIELETALEAMITTHERSREESS